MKLPRNIDGDELASLLVRYGYHITHQTGSHQRLSAEHDGKVHDLTIPRNKPLRVGKSKNPAEFFSSSRF